MGRGQRQRHLPSGFKAVPARIQSGFAGDSTDWLHNSFQFISIHFNSFQFISIHFNSFQFISWRSRHLAGDEFVDRAEMETHDGIHFIHSYLMHSYLMYFIRMTWVWKSLWRRLMNRQQKRWRKLAFGCQGFGL